MKRLAAVMMFAAWLLYGAMPALALPVTAPAPQEAMEVHPGHHDMQAMGHDSEAARAVHQHGNTEKPCPHGSGKGCVAPFCAACLVLPADIAFAEAGGFVHSHPEPDDGPSLVLSTARPPTPPPRA